MTTPTRIKIPLEQQIVRLNRKSKRQAGTIKGLKTYIGSRDKIMKELGLSRERLEERVKELTSKRVRVATELNGLNKQLDDAREKAEFNEKTLRLLKEHTTEMSSLIESALKIMYPWLLDFYIAVEGDGGKKMLCPTDRLLIELHNMIRYQNTLVTRKRGGAYSLDATSYMGRQPDQQQYVRTG